MFKPRLGYLDKCEAGELVRMKVGDTSTWAIACVRQSAFVHTVVLLDEREGARSRNIRSEGRMSDFDIPVLRYGRDFDLEVDCLASQLPEFVTIDLGELTKGQTLHVSDLKLPKGIKAVKHGTLNPVVVAVTAPKAEEEEAAPAPVVAAPPAPTKGKKDEKQNKK